MAMPQAVRLTQAPNFLQMGCSLLTPSQNNGTLRHVSLLLAYLLLFVLLAPYARTTAQQQHCFRPS